MPNNRQMAAAQRCYDRQEPEESEEMEETETKQEDRHDRTGRDEKAYKRVGRR